MYALLLRWQRIEMHLHCYTISENKSEGDTSREEPITSPILLQENFHNMIFYDVFQLSLGARSTTQLGQTSKSPQNRSICNNIDFLTNTTMWTPSVVNICLFITIGPNFLGIGKRCRINIRVDLQLKWQIWQIPNQQRLHHQV